MTTRLTEQLTEAAGRMPDVDLAEIAWRRAYAERRRRRYAAVGAAAGLAVVAGGTLAALERRPVHHIAAPSTTTTASGTMASTNSGSPSTSTLPGMDILPDAEGVRALPRQVTVATWLAARDEWDLRRLSRPLSTGGGFAAGERLVAAYADPARRQIAVVTSAGRVLRLDGLTLRDQTDGYNASFHLSNQAISSDGRFLAIAQPGRVIIVDVERTGVADPWSVVTIDDGRLESANAVEDGRRVLVTSEAATYLVDTASARVEKTLAPVWDAQEVVLASVGPVGQPAQETTVRQWRPASADFSDPVPIGLPTTGVWGLGGSVTSGHGWVAALASPPVANPSGPSGYQGIAARQIGGAEERFLLDSSDPTSSGAGRSKGGVLPLAVEAGGAVIVWAGGPYDTSGIDVVMRYADLLAWDLTSGSVVRLARLTGDPVQIVLAPS